MILLLKKLLKSLKMQVKMLESIIKGDFQVIRRKIITICTEDVTT